MRVLLVDCGHIMRGGQWQTIYLARGLRNARHSVRILARGELLDRLRAERFESRPASALRVLHWSQWADLTHAQDARAHTLAALTCWKPFVVSRRVAFAVRDSAASRWKYRRPALYAAVSRYVGATLEHAGIDPARIRTVYDGIPQPARVKSWPDRPIPLLALRTGDPMKGDDLIAEAAHLAGLTVRWTETVADLREARVFVYISRSEGLGSAALMAMANGVAVIASHSGGLEEAVTHERTGLLVENRPADIAAALLRLHKEPEFAARLAAAARTDAARRFSIGRMVKDTIRLYREIAR